MLYRLCFLLLVSVPLMAQKPISLHPTNPHYLVFRGKPTVLLSYSESGNAVSIPKFDFVRYLDTLQKYGFNFTQLPLYGLSEGSMYPWAMNDDETKFDLDKWDEAYFGRLTDFVAQAARRGIVVEVKLFSTFQKEYIWFNDPFHPSKNINIHNNFSCSEVYTADNGELSRYQDALAAKVVEELNGFDNVIYEVLSTNWSDCSGDGEFIPSAARMAWQTNMADVIMQTESNLPNKHLLVQSINARSETLPENDVRYQICTFHEGSSKAVGLNSHLRQVIGCDEVELEISKKPLGHAWQFMLAGGGFYKHLDSDFSYRAFTTPSDDIDLKASTEGIVFRKQLSFLKQFIESFDFASMKPDTASIKADVSCWVLGKTGQDYAAYIEGSNMGDLTLTLPEGKYFAIFVDIQHGEIIRSGPFKSNGTPYKLHYQHPMSNWALRVIRQ